ncbi:hypothetical protein [uncultured Pseudonocardia sp.]|uniref:hypothetical protein n=1 Tax=uncultured Pseudonocardia sp. TaxID=211455 RepID=UPI00261B2B6E|nr:hypothetical protein [uncultured Pseudonocardia sp.]
MSNEFDQLATKPGAMVQIATTGDCLNEYMLIEGRAQVGDAIACDAGCGATHQVRDVVPMELVRTVEIPTPRREARGRTIAAPARDRQGIELSGPQ